MLESWLAGVPAWVVYVATFMSIAGEVAIAAGMVLPSTTMLLIVGLLAQLDVVRLWAVIVVAIAAGLVGDNLGFLSGRRLGRRIRSTRLGRWVGDARWARTDTFMAKHGVRAVFLGQWVVVVRTLIPRAAASSGMPYRRFVLANSPAVVGWAAAFAGAGYLAGRSYQQVSAAVGRASGALGLLTLVTLVLLAAGRWAGRHPEPVQAVGAALRRSRIVRWLKRDTDVVAAGLDRRFGHRASTAINLGVGLVLMVLVAAALIGVSQLVVGVSGLPGIDRPLVVWMRAHQDRDTELACLAIVSVLRSSFVIVIAAVIAVIAVIVRRHQQASDALSILGTAGGFLPLFLLSWLFNWLTPDTPAPDPNMPTSMTFLGTQVAVVTAAIWLLALTIARGLSWKWASAIWTIALLVVLVVAAARSYVGWSWPSAVLGAILLGGLWAAILAATWNSRLTRIAAADPERPEPGSTPTGKGFAGSTSAKAMPDIGR